MWFCALRSAKWLNKNAGANPETKWAQQLGSMAYASLVGYAIGGAFLSLQYFDLPYNIMAMIVIARKWVESRAWETEKATFGRLSFLGFGPLVPDSAPAGRDGSGRGRRRRAKPAISDAPSASLATDAKSRK
jgi:hypothetical protein